jgi:hypothetical protein
VIIERRFNGPADSGQGGITCGLLAGTTDYPVAEVTLRLPPPLDVEMAVRDGSLLHGDDVVATVAPGEVTLQPPAPVSVATAAAAPSALGGHDHPFPACFVCGPDRADGLRLLPGRLSDDVVASVWTPAEVSEVMVWAALDCPSGWSVDIPGRPMVLGRMACVIDCVPTVGAEHVIQGWHVATEGRKVFTGSALYDAEGSVLAVAQATWITLQR